MHKMKRVLSIVLAVCMLVSILSTGVLAASISISTKPENGTTKGQPFAPGTGGSQNFRIPGITTLDNGRVVATIDARWSWLADAGGIDTLVSVSDDNGANWTYTFANYLGDNGDVANNQSCCFIDPAIATDGTTLYMIADLYPAGFAINSAKYYAQPGSTGFDANGNLLLRSDSENGITFGAGGYENGAKNATYGYYLSDGKIYTTEGAEVEGYTVDAYFNITGNDINTNLFFGDSPYKPFPTDFLYLTTSTDGLTWSEPELLDVKAAEEQSYLVGPGNGTYDAVNDRMIFTAYRHTAGANGTAYECASLIWMDAEGNWKRSEDCTTANWSSEASSVVLADGTVRVFYRDGFSVLRYTDMIWDETTQNYVRDPKATEVATSAAKRSGCQLTTILYSEKIDGKEVVLVATAADSGARKDGHLYVFTVNEDKSMNLAYDYDIFPGVIEDYAYNCITELNDGSIGLLFESTGSEIIYHVIDMADVLVRDNDPSLTVKNVELLEGYTATFTDNSGCYVDADISELDTDVATLTMTGEEVTTNAAKVLGTGASIDLDSCQYTFTLGEDGYYEVSAATLDGETVYLNHFSTTGNSIPNLTSPAGKIAILASSHENMFKLQAQIIEGGSGAARGLHFHMEYDTPYWNRCGNDSSVKCHEYLYRKAAADETASTEVPGYVRITSLEQIENGGKYLIAAKNDAGNWFVLNPSTSTEKFNHVAQIMGSTTVGSTELTFTGVAAGSTEVVVGSTLYKITVHDVSKVAVDLTVGNTKTFTEASGNYADADTADLDTAIATVTMTGVDGTAANGLSLEPVSELPDGTYVIVNTRANKLLTNAPVSAEAAAGAGSGLKLDGTVMGDVAENAVWTITNSNGSYTIQDLSGKYMTISSNNASVADDSATLTLNWRGSTWTIAQNGAYLNHFGGGSSICAAGWQDGSAAGDAGSQFAIYSYAAEPVSASTEITFAGVAVGETEILIGRTLYQITVTEGEDPVDPPVEPPVDPEPTDPVMPPEMDADDDSWDIPVSELTATCGDYEPDGGASEGPAHLVLDGNNATMWHTDWQGTSRDNHWIQLEVKGDYAVCGLRYLPRQTGNSNGTITKYEIQISDDGENFTKVAEGNWAADSTWKLAQFPGEKTKYVRLVSLDAVTDNDWVFASAAEIRLTYLPTEVSDADKTALNALIAECELIEDGNYTARSWQQFQKALEKAQTVSANPYASQAQVDEALADLAAAKEGLKEQVEGEGIYKIFHLDSGRKYFSKDFHIALLNELSAAGYTHLQLAFGNNGLRFLLDDMTVEANNTTYSSDDIKAGIKIGNDNYGALTGYSTGDAHALTQAEMDEIIAHAKSVGIEIIPHLNMPGHMSALLDAMDHIGIEDAHFTGRVESDSSVNLNNEEALNFMFALTDKYAQYFSSKGVKYFHIGADEYANDAYNGSMGFPSMGADLYAKFAQFVNSNAAIVKKYNMTPIAWNDGIYYGSYTSEFDSDIVIDYWSSGWWGYTLSKASTLDGKGHGLINTNGDYYYILGKDDRFTPGSTSTHDPDMYTECAGYDLNRFMDGSTIENPLGGMFCVWADYPGAETEAEVAANVRLVLRAMALRMEGLDLDGMNTDVVPGGFNADGSINGETPVCEHEKTEIRDDKAATCTEPGYTGDTYCVDCKEKIAEGEVIAAKGHTPAEAVKENEKAATCTEAGSYDSVVYCSVCQAELSRETVTVPASCPSVIYTDVPVGEWYHESVDFVTEKGIMNGMGDGLFAPAATTNRAQIAVILYRMAGSPSVEGMDNPFTDVPSVSWFTDAVIWAADEGIVKGMDATTFAPDANVTRAQLVTMFYRYAGSPTVDRSVLTGYTDAGKLDFSTDAFAWAIAEGVVNGMTETTLEPLGTANRAQIATILARYLSK